MADQWSGMNESERRDNNPDHGESGTARSPLAVAGGRRGRGDQHRGRVAAHRADQGGAGSPVDRASRGDGPSQTMAPDWVRIGKELKPAVVNIAVKRNAEREPARREGLPPGGEGLDQFRRFFEGREPRRPVRDMGTGFIINADGYIVTNNHVVDGASEIQVKLADGRELPGKIVGGDAKTDLAVVKIEAVGLPVIAFGDSAKLEVGEPVMAIGNPFGLEATVTTGIVSATGRVIGSGPYDDYIQTDASINPGTAAAPSSTARARPWASTRRFTARRGARWGSASPFPRTSRSPW